jgi:hypothetical protein
VWSITRSRRAIWVLTLFAILILSITAASWSSSWTPRQPGDSEAGSSASAPTSLTPGLPALETPGALPPAVISPPKAVVRIEGKPAPGLGMALHADGPAPPENRYRWVQTRGPAVQLVDPSAKTARFTVPEGTGPMGFMLAVSNGLGMDVAEVSIPLERLSHPAESASSPLRADAGDDQLGLVGRQVTLNGVRSEPKGTIGYRWLQVGGPPVRMQLEDGYIYSFLPMSAGVYRFALVVASGSQISEPKLVTVTVGSGSAPGPAGERGAVAVVVPTQEVARSGLASVGGTRQVGEELARIFEDASDRMDLYDSYADAFREMSRRLEDMLARDPGRRNLWVERVFTPLTARVIDVLQAEGLDLRLPEAQAAAMASNQKDALAQQFRLMADGFRNGAKAP